MQNKTPYSTHKGIKVAIPVFLLLCTVLTNSVFVFLFLCAYNCLVQIWLSGKDWLKIEGKIVYIKLLLTSLQLQIYSLFEFQII